MKKKLIVGLLILVFLALLTRHLDIRLVLVNLLERIRGIGIWGPVVFVSLYVLACVFFIPGWVLTLGGGALFGVFWGSVYVSLGSTLGAATAFLIGRYLARGWVTKTIETNPKFKRLNVAVACEGWKIVGLVRLSPLFPYNLVNYAFGITSVPFRDYFFATWICMLPATVMYVYVGSLAGDLTKLGLAERSRGPAEWALYVLGLIATIVVSVYVTRLAHKAMTDKMAGEGVG